jgi:hypothetical protein
MHRATTLTRTAWSIIAAATLAISLATSVHAAAPHYSNIIVSDTEHGNDKAVFVATTPKIYVNAEIDHVTTGMKLTGKWIAEKTQVAPPNYEIAAANVAPSPKMNQATFSLSKPDHGWPAGTYRVELLIDDKLAEVARFKVAP